MGDTKITNYVGKFCDHAKDGEFVEKSKIFMWSTSTDKVWNEHRKKISYYWR